MRSENEPRCEGWTRGCDGGASIRGMAGTSIFGPGGGGGGGGLNWDVPGGIICCAQAALPAASAQITAQIVIDRCFMRGMSVSQKQTATKLFFRCVFDRVEPVGLEAQQVP